MSRKLALLLLVTPLAAALLFRSPEALSQFSAASCGIGAKNFDIVAPGFYRGGKPSLADLDTLHQMGVRTIIDFTMANRQAEREKARALGMKYVNIPWDTDTWMTWFYDYNRVSKKFFSLIDDPANLPVYVHCLSGRDRTGMVVALYRMRTEGWSFDEAFSEMKRYGHDESVYPNLAEYLRKTEIELKAHPSLLKPPAPPAGTRLFQHAIEEEPNA
jgi:protein tyrosine/serine phosphatase